MKLKQNTWAYQNFTNVAYLFCAFSVMVKQWCFNLVPVESDANLVAVIRAHCNHIQSRN